MRAKGENAISIEPGVFVMNYHHGLLRFGVVQSKRHDEQGWAQYTVDWLEDDKHTSNAVWVENMTGTQKAPTEYRADWLKPVSPEWLQRVISGYKQKNLEA